MKTRASLHHFKRNPQNQWTMQPGTPNKKKDDFSYELNQNFFLGSFSLVFPGYFSSFWFFLGPRRFVNPFHGEEAWKSWNKSKVTCIMTPPKSKEITRAVYILEHKSHQSQFILLKTSMKLCQSKSSKPITTSISTNPGHHPLIT